MAIRVGIVGFGLGATAFHLPFLLVNPEYRVVAVASSDEGKVRAKLSEARVFKTPEELFRDKEVDLVLIASPTYTHFTLARLALLAGKHVVIDKPFVAHVAEGEELISIATHKGVVLSVYHNRRWDADYLTALQVTHSGALGEVMLYEAHADRFRPVVMPERWREKPLPGSGALYDVGSHLIDQALQLFGEPERVTGEACVQRENGVTTDFFSVTLQFGLRRAVLRSSSLRLAPGPRFELHGTLGSFVKPGHDRQEERLRAGHSPADPSWGSDEPSDFGTLTTMNDGKISAQVVPSIPGNWGHFYTTLAKSITKGELPPVPAEEALEVIRVIEQVEN